MTQGLPHNSYTFIDLFAGIGGLRLAFEMAGATCVFGSEYEKFCRQTYEANFGKELAGDIREIPSEAVPTHDVLVGGFPCQPFSIAGVSKKNSLGRPTGFRDVTQGTLFFEVARIMEATRPKAYMLENVKNLLSHDKGNTFSVMQRTLRDLGYSVDYAILDGRLYVPQHRERVVIVGFDERRYGAIAPFEFAIAPPTRKPVMADILETSPDQKYTLTDRLWKYLQAYAEKHRAAGHGFGFGIAPLDGCSRTLSARYYKDGSEILIEQAGRNPRRLTPRECARLQGFPESFVIPVSNTQAYKQFGNSVVVPLMTDVATLVLRRLEELDAGDDSIVMRRK